MKATMKTTITTSQAPELLKDVLRAGLVPMMHSSPGIGKSSIAKDLAKAHNLKVIDLRLSQCDPTDLSGFPSIDRENNIASYVPMDTFPTENTPFPKKDDGTSYSGWLLLLDEINSAPLMVQASAYKLVLDRQVGQFDLHKDVAMMAAGNLITDKAIVNKLSTAMASRMVHFELEVSHKEWLIWAADNDIDTRLTSYIAYKPDSLHSFNSNMDDKTFSCPRTLEFASRIIKDWPTIPNSKRPVLVGTLGTGVANEFMTFCKIFDKLPKIEDILNDPKGFKYDENEPSVNFALSGIIAANVNDKTLGSLMDVLNRMPKEFQVLTMQDMMRRRIELRERSEIQKWGNRKH